MAAGGPLALAPNKELNRCSAVRVLGFMLGFFLPTRDPLSRPIVGLSDLQSQEPCRAINYNPSKAALHRAAHSGGHTMHMQQAGSISDPPDASTKVTGYPGVPVSSVPCPHADLIFSPMRLRPPQHITSNTRCAPTDDCLGHRTTQDRHTHEQRQHP